MQSYTFDDLPHWEKNFRIGAGGPTGTKSATTFQYLLVSSLGFETIGTADFLFTFFGFVCGTVSLEVFFPKFAPHRSPICGATDADFCVFSLFFKSSIPCSVPLIEISILASFSDDNSNCNWIFFPKLYTIHKIH